MTGLGPAASTGLSALACPHWPCRSAQCAALLSRLVEAPRELPCH